VQDILIGGGAEWIIEIIESIRMKILIRMGQEVSGYLDTAWKALESLLDVGYRCKMVSASSSFILKFVLAAINHLIIHSFMVSSSFSPAVNFKQLKYLSQYEGPGQKSG
jgi:hypothetical protein